MGCRGVFGQLNKAHEVLRTNVSCRLTKGSGDDSDEEGGASHPKKQRRPKERRRIEKVPWFSNTSLPKVFGS